MKTKEELKQIKEEYTVLSLKLAELEEDELKQVTGGVSVLDRYNIARPVLTPMGEMFKIDINNDFSTETTGYRQGGAMNETTKIPGLEAIGPYVPLDSDSKLK